ncbi:MAG: hypothetical protein HYY65_14135 [Candidatus Tectomicrobia bacterium]|uniref:Zinc ribbon domain-containing protein n=1 Tax=Tectimicrobiota bacterium TaxID=2528274 RepID=A0A932M249_UNCTE|nr:hypothetical protein [Candidatus Tectomicrobia bacterium]
METVLIVTLVLGTLAFVGWPLVRPAVSPRSQGKKELEALESEKEVVYAALKDLELDHRMGKIDAKDYGELKDRYRLKALTLLEQIDRTTQKRGLVDEQVMDAIDNHRGEARFCAQCGTPRGAGDHFCRICGAELAAIVTS